MRRLLAIGATAAALAGLGAAVFYGFAAPPAAPEPAPRPATIVPNPVVGAADAPAPIPTAPSVRLVGVLMQPPRSTALLEVDGRPARSFREGETVSAPWSLARVAPEFVVMTNAKDSVRIALAAASGRSPPDNFVNALEPPASQDRGEAPAPVPLEVARERNRAFLDAVKARSAGR